MDLKTFVLGWMTGVAMGVPVPVFLYARGNIAAFWLLTGLFMSIVMIAFFLVYQVIQAKITIDIQRSDNYPVPPPSTVLPPPSAYEELEAVAKPKKDHGKIRVISDR